MAEKFITSRVKQRFDTLTEWQKVWETFIPLKGEVCKVQIPANTAVAGLRTSSSVRVMTKTGNGETPLKDLPWDSAIGADETQLSKGTDATASATLTHGGTFTAVTDTTVNGHKITDKTTTYTLPAETVLSVDQTKSSTQKTPAHGGTFDVVTSVVKGDSSHNVDVTTTTVKLPSETGITVDTLTAQTGTLTHGGNFTALTAAVKGGTSHNIDVTPTTFTMPAETALTVDQGTASSSKPAHGGTVTVISGVTKGDSSHNLDIAKTTITFPSETTLSKGTDATPETQTLAHGGTFTAITDIGVSGHTVTDKPTTFTLPSETTLSVTDSESGNAVTDVTVSGHAITLKRGKTFLTAHPTISVETDSTSSQTATHGGTFTAVDSVTRDANGHVTKINTKTVTLPTDNDTKNTAGGGNTSSKIYIVGVTSQATGTSYTHDTAYVGTDGCLYSGGSKVLTSYTDTKNTAGSTNTSSKIFLVGATSQAANPQTYSHDTAYVGTDGHLYSNSTKVFSESYAPEAYLQWGGSNIVGGVSPVGASLSSEHSANRLAYLNPNALSFEYSDNAGSTWSTMSISDDTKIGFVTTSGTFKVGNAVPVTTNHRSRVTITAQNGTNGYVYTRPRKLLLNVSTSGHGLSVLIETKTGATNASWTTVGTYTLNGWSGWNDIPLSFTTLGGSTNQTSNIWYMRLTFAITSVSSNYSNSSASIIGMRLFGDTCWTKTSNMGETGHLYSYDTAQNAAFPAAVTATSFSGNGASLSNLNASNISTGTVAAARLPAATTSAKGAVIVGSNITVSSGTISLTKANVTTALGYTPPTTDTTYSVATASTAGLVKPVSVITKPTLNSVTTTSGKYYQVQMSSDGNMFVNVPWSDTNTTYTFNGAVSTIKDSNLTASRALISDSSGKVAVSAVTSTELGYLEGVTSAIQTQLNGKASSTHGHAWKTF